MNINEDFTKRSKIQDVGRWHITQFVKRVAESLPPGSFLLDAGAGECAYKQFFSHCEYRAVDSTQGESTWDYGNLDYTAPLDQLPIEDEQFDGVLCTQVLEHIEWPRECMKELYRVLRSGGKLFLTAPMSHAEHQAPYDYFRYTSFGLKSICEKAGFENVEVSPFGGIFTRWAYELPRALKIFPGTGLRTGRITLSGLALLSIRAFVFTVIRISQLILLWLDRFDKAKNDPFGFALIASKPRKAGR